MLSGLNQIVDLSHYQQEVDFRKVAAAGIVGVIHKATQGEGPLDPTYDQRRKEALNAGLLWGAYHFGTCCDGVAQAEHFLDLVQPDSSTLLALDFEANKHGPSMSLEEARAFVTHVLSSDTHHYEVRRQLPLRGVGGI